MIELQYYLSNVPDCLIYGLLAMGIYISLRILDIPDLTTEGSFGFGAVISVLVALAGHPILALFAGMIAGGFAGVITGFLQTKLKVHPVLAGIITMSGLYSINLVCYSLTEKGATTNLSYNKITVFEKIKQSGILFDYLSNKYNIFSVWLLVKKPYFLYYFNLFAKLYFFRR